MALQNIVQIQAARKRQDRRRTQRTPTVGEWIREGKVLKAALVGATQAFADHLRARPECMIDFRSLHGDHQFATWASMLGRDEEGGA